MNSVLLISLSMLGFAGAIMLLLPYISPRRYFFAITVPPGFPRTDEGRAISRFYQWCVLLDIAGAAVLMFLLGDARPELAPAAAFLIPFAAGLTQFLVARAKASRFAQNAAAPIREAELVVDEDHFPRWFALALAPFLFPIGAALYLRAHWDELPARIPVHFGWNGEPNRWVDKTPHAVYGMLAANTGMLLLLLLTGLATYLGSRRLPQRTVIMKIMVAVCYFMSLLFCGTALLPLLHLSPLWIMIPAPLLIVLVGIWIYQAVRNPSTPSEATPDNCWILGSIYINSQDPAVFVQKRIGFGYTLNFGNRLSWAYLTIFAALTVLLLVVR